MNQLETANIGHFEDLIFLALTVWREARNQLPAAKLAVAYSILTRVEKPTWWGNDVLSVVSKKWQYSSMTALDDPNLIDYPTRNDPSWLASLDAASVALAKSQTNPAPDADSYFDDSIKPPNWTLGARHIIKIDRLDFWEVAKDYEHGAGGRT